MLSDAKKGKSACDSNLKHLACTAAKVKFVKNDLELVLLSQNAVHS